jgi:molybdopterin molybdotransferase
MLSLEEALARIVAAIQPPEIEECSLSQLDGRVLAESALAFEAVPPFDNSSMDGYAVRASDTAHAKAENPARLRLVGRVAAGETFPTEVKSGACVRLFTGSPMPRGADAVVMQEDTRVESGTPDEVLVLELARPWENVRFRGEDIKAGSMLLEAGQLLGAPQISLLGACGLASVRVGRQPSVGLLATGSELVEPGQKLGAGRIYESNRLGLATFVHRVGGVPKIFPLVPDVLEGTRRALALALSQCDVVITSGGVSVGEMDFVKHAFEAEGGELDFWKVAIKPGRPFVFGRQGSKLLFGLPGNPVSALVTYLLLVRPALLRWQGATRLAMPAAFGVAAEPLANPGIRRHFMRVRLDAAGKVYSAGTQASHLLSSMAAANGLVDMAPGTTVSAGEKVQVLQWE